MSDMKIPGGTPNSSYINDTGDVQFKSDVKLSGKQEDVSDIPEKKADVKDRGFVPDSASPNVDMNALKGMMCASYSPGAMLAALCIKDAAQQYEQNVGEVFKRSQAIQKDIMKQADNIERGALKQMIFQIAGAVASASASIAAGVKVGKLNAGADNLTVKQAMTNAEMTMQIGKSADQTLNAIGSYLNAREQADNKRLDAAIEQSRTAMEAIKNSMQAQRDLMSKSIEFMSSMQASMNQSMAKILG